MLFDIILMMNAMIGMWSLKATSTGSKAKIQVGIVVIENGEIIDQYTTDVNPRMNPWILHIKRING